MYWKLTTHPSPCIALSYELTSLPIAALVYCYCLSVDWVIPENIQSRAPYGELLKITTGWISLRGQNLTRKVWSFDLNFHRGGVGKELKPKALHGGSVISCGLHCYPTPSGISRGGAQPPPPILGSGCQPPHPLPPSSQGLDPALTPGFLS